MEKRKKKIYFAPPKTIFFIKESRKIMLRRNNMSVSKIILSCLALLAVHANADTRITCTGIQKAPQGLFKDAQGGLLYATLGTNYITIDGTVTSFGSYAFHNCSTLTSLKLPESVTSVEYFAFSNCTALTSPIYNSTIFARFPISKSGSYVLPSSINTIASAAFRDCTSLSSIALNDALTTIEASAFANCTSLSSIAIPKNVTVIGECAFWNCTNMTALYVNSEKPAKIYSSTFQSINKDKCILFVPKGSATTYKSKNYWKDFKIIVEITSENKFRGYDVQGDLSTEEAFNALNQEVKKEDGGKPVIIDLTAVTAIPDSAEIQLSNPNSLIKTTSLLTLANSKNVINDGICKNFVLTDGFDFYCDETFTAQYATYTRNTSSRWGSLCLPFAVNTNDNIQYYQCKTNSSTNGSYVVLSSVNGVEANMPCFFSHKGEIKLTANNVQIRATNDAFENTSQVDQELKGTYCRLTLDATTEKQIYYLSNDRLYYAEKSTTIPAFRSWFESANAQIQNAMPRVIELRESESLLLEDIESEAAPQSTKTFDIWGRPINSQHSIITIYTGKKIITENRVY